MQSKRSPAQPVAVLVGYAAGSRGQGIAYARLSGMRTQRLLRLGFRVAPPRTERAIGYAALTAVAKAIASRGVADATFVLGDPEFADEIATGRDVAETLAIPYVRLRCALNSFEKFAVRAGATDDLTQRARAEVAFNIAA